MKQVLLKLLLVTLLSLTVVEGVLQAAAFVGWLPRLNVATHVPYGRVYWTLEGFGNSVMNRYGWHVPDFRLAPGSRRIVLIGDSYIDGLQVRPDQNVGVMLERLLSDDRKENDPPVEVLSLGISGYGPAQYLEMVRYAIEYLAPTEIVVFVTLANDFRDVMVADPEYPPEMYVYYRINTRGDLELDPRSIVERQALQDRLRRNHRSLLANLPRTLQSHYLTPKVWGAIAHAVEPGSHSASLSMTDRPAKDGAEAPWFIGEQRAMLFKKERPKEVLDATRMVMRLLAMARDVAISHGIAFRLVTIPHFPNAFYEPDGDDRSWTPDLGEYDLFLPERDLQAFSKAAHVPMLPMGEYMQKKGISIGEVRSLFFYEGLAHFTPAGHAFFAEALKSRFYASGAPSESGSHQGSAVLSHLGDAAGF